MISSHRLAARTPDSRSGNRGSSPRESIAICPHCKEPFALPGDQIVLTAERPIGVGDFTVCLSCREIIRFNDQLHLIELEEQDWFDLMHHKDMFVAMLRWRLHILADQLQARYHG